MKFFSVILLLYLFWLSSCINTKKIVYFNNINDSILVSPLANLEPVIQKNDLFSITVSSLNATASELFNMPNIMANQTTQPGTVQITGYLVDSQGEILFPVLGKIKAAGISKKALADIITRGLIDKKLLLDPIVNIRYLNFRISILGEVSNPSVHIIPSEKITILEALGLAGDLTLFAKRNNVLLIREQDERKIIKRLDLTSKDLLTSPYYYLKSNDVIYVEPSRSKIASASRANQWVPVFLSACSVAIVAITSIAR